MMVLNAVIMLTFLYDMYSWNRF